MNNENLVIEQQKFKAVANAVSSISLLALLVLVPLSVIFLIATVIWGFVLYLMGGWIFLISVYVPTGIVAWLLFRKFIF